MAVKGGPPPVQLFKKVFTKEKAGDWVEEVLAALCFAPSPLHTPDHH